MLRLGKAGILWTRKSLSTGRACSQYLARTLDLVSGETVVPGIESLPSRAVDDLAISIAHVFKTSLRTAAEPLFKIVWSVMAETRMLLVEDDMRRPTDPNILREDPVSLIRHDGIIFHLRDLTELTTPDRLITFLGASASGYPLNAFLVSGLSRDGLAQLLEADKFENLVPHVEVVINTIFDCDGYAAWLGPRAQTILGLYAIPVT